MTQKELSTEYLLIQKLLNEDPKRVSFSRVRIYVQITLLILDAFAKRFLVNGVIVLPHWLKVWNYIYFARDVYNIIKENKRVNEDSINT
jgi:hypothetical protein